MTKGNNETFGDDGHVFDCDNGFIGVCLCQTWSNCALEIHVIYQMPIISQ